MNKQIPLFKQAMIDTHCHLDYLDPSPEETLKKCQQVNVQKIITISVTPENLNTVVEMANKSDSIFCSQGVHPHSAKEWSDQCLNTIKENIANPKVVAIGEIGLDYHYDHSPREQQRKVFEEQLQLACDNNFPVIVHSRDAERDTQDIIRNFSSNLPKKGVIHSFSSSAELANFALSENFYLGLNGIMTFKKAENICSIIKDIPIDRILLETDAPFLTPHPFRGKENSPTYLPFIALKLSTILNIPIEKLLTQLYENSTSLFHL